LQEPKLIFETKQSTVGDNGGDRKNSGNWPQRKEQATRSSAARSSDGHVCYYAVSGNRQPEAALPEAVMAMSATTQSAVIATARGQKIKHKRKQSCGGDNSCNNQPASTKNSNWHPHKKP